MKVSLAVVSTLTVAIVYALAEYLFQSRQAGVFAAAVTAVYPFFVLQATDIQTEELFMFLLIASILTMLKAGRRGAFLLAGGLAGMAALVRPIGLLLLILLPAYVVVSYKRGDGRKWRHSLGMFLAGAALCIGPWTIRNAVRFQEVILINDAAGYNFWRGTNADLAAISRTSDPDAFRAASLHFETVVWPPIARHIEQSAATPAERSKKWFRLAGKDFMDEPRSFLLRLLQNAWMFWRPWLNPATFPKAVVFISGVAVSLLYVTGALGWTILRKEHKRTAHWFAFCALSFWISQLPFQVVSRFRVSTADPLLIVFAAGYLSGISSRRSRAFRQWFLK